MDKFDPVLGFPKPVSGSQIKADTAAGHGSTLTNVRYFTNVYDESRGDMVVVNSAINGFSVHIKTSGLYTVSYTDSFGTASYCGVTKNETVAIGSAVSKNIICATQNAAGISENCSGSEWLKKGDVIRCNTSAAGVDTASRVRFTITRIA